MPHHESQSIDLIDFTQHNDTLLMIDWIINLTQLQQALVISRVLFEYKPAEHLLETSLFMKLIHNE